MSGVGIDPLRSNGFPPSEWLLTQRAEPFSPQTGPESRSTLYFAISPSIYPVSDDSRVNSTKQQLCDMFSVYLADKFTSNFGCHLLQPNISMSVSFSIMCAFDFVIQHRLIVATSSVPSIGDWSMLWSVTHIQHSGFDPGIKSIKVRSVVSTAWPSFRLFFSLFSRQIPHTYFFEAFQPYRCIWHRNERNYSASSIHPSNCGWQTIFREILLRCNM